ncbi:hypothetical protein ACNQ0T_00525 [Enterobacter cloacae complex sp.6700776]|uniref:hypothetical protein n=1 Tax=Enterobacter cloacae complex sp.6700776 TaxID=3397179 RepID=UPI003AAA9B99
MKVLIFEEGKYSVVITEKNTISLENKFGYRYERPVSTYANSVMNKFIRCVMIDIPDDKLLNQALSEYGEEMKVSKIRWVDVYSPYGEWQDDNGIIVKTPSIFRATYNNINLMVVMVDVKSAPGHGEPSVTAKRPQFIDEDNLDFVKVDGNFIVLK